MGKGLYCIFHGNGQARQLFKTTVQPTGLGLASFNNFSRPWCIETVPGCMVPGPGVMKAEEEWP